MSLNHHEVMLVQPDIRQLNQNIIPRMLPKIPKSKKSKKKCVDTIASNTIILMPVLSGFAGSPEKYRVVKSLLERGY